MADLKGRTVLVDNLRDIGTPAVTAQLRAAGLSETNVKSAATGDAITSGQADARARRVASGARKEIEAALPAYTTIGATTASEIALRRSSW